MRLAWPFVVVAMLAGCRLYPPPALAVVQHGPAHAAPVRTVVALPPDPAQCAPEHAGAVASAMRMTLEFAGYSLVDSELMNAEMRRRTTKTGETAVRGGSTSESRTEVTGRTWLEAAPEERRALVAAVGADGLLYSSITATPGDHIWITRYTVALTLTTLDAQVVWTAKCTDDAGDQQLEQNAIERATRCALESAALW